jgi:N-acetylglucosaminyldiphosphoundecaprenol N-acetyl-beta-D-mannosaminyltransferase
MRPIPSSPGTSWPGGARTHDSRVSAPLSFGGVAVTELKDFPPPATAQCWIYVTLNAEIALGAAESEALQHIVRQGRARVSVDGQWIWWALRLKYPRQTVCKLSGSDLIYRLAEHCQRQGQRLLLLGSDERNNATAVARLRQAWPALHVAGFAPPAFRAGSAGEVAATVESLKAIHALRPDFVVLGLGARKEHRMAERLAPGLDGEVTGLLCFGGAIDLASGHERRAPRWLQQVGLEGLFRVLQRPRRLPRLLRVTRILPTLLLRRY